jgi:acyl carrier protein
MTESEFIDIVCAIRNVADRSAFERELEASPLDSLDLLELRAALEVRLRKPLTVEKFPPKSTLQDLFRLVNR